MEPNTVKKDELKEKIHDVIEYIGNSFYTQIEDIEINGKKYNSFILLSTAAVISDKSLLVRGNYGLGKTTTSEALDALIYLNPLEISSQSMIRSNPEIMREDIVGYLNIPKLTQEGKEEIEWSLFVKKDGVKIVDEFNRMPENKQILLLDSIERGIFAYKSQIYKTGKKPFIATVNYKDGGNYELNLAILDRFELSINVSPTPYIEYIAGDIRYELLPEEIKKKLQHLDKEYEEALLKENNENKMKELRRWYVKERMKILGAPYHCSILKEKLSSPDIAEEMYKVYMNHNDEKTIRKIIKGLKKKYGSILKKRGIPYLTSLEKEKVKLLSEVMYLDKDAMSFFNNLYKEINATYKDPSVSSNLTSRNIESPVYMIKNNLSPRIVRVLDIAKVVAFITGKDKVDLEIIQSILPYALSHKIILNENIEQEIRENLGDITKKDFVHRLATKFVEKYKEYYVRNLEQFREFDKSIILGGDLNKITLPSKYIYMNID